MYVNRLMLSKIGLIHVLKPVGSYGYTVIIRLCVSHNNIFALVTGLSYYGEHWQSWGFMPKRDMY